MRCLPRHGKGANVDSLAQQSAVTPDPTPLILRASSLRVRSQFRLGGVRNWRARVRLRGEATFRLRASFPGSPSLEASVTLCVREDGKPRLVCPECHGQFPELQASRCAEKPIFSCPACANSGACGDRLAVTGAG